MSVKVGVMAERVLVLACLVAVSIGLIGAFVGLSTSSFWIDELWTAWVIGSDHDLRAALQRTITDIHPPVYYMTVRGVAESLGRTEVAMRGLSAVSAVAALLLFGFGTRALFSLPARLVAMTLAVVSGYWFFQAQNARSYSFAMMLAAVMLVLGVRILTRRRAALPVAGTLAALVLVAVLGSLTHFYLTFVAVAVFLALAVLCRGLRAVLVAAAAVPVVVALGYFELVVRPYSVVSMSEHWVRDSIGWYVRKVWGAGLDTVTGAAAMAMLVVMLLAAVAQVRPAGVRAALWRGDARLFVLMVPPLVLAAGVASSMVMSPNVTIRNLLLVSPFLWGTTALLYDLGIARVSLRVSRPALRSALMLGLAGLALLTTPRVRERLRPQNEPFRESARWIDAQPGCEGATIPVMLALVSPMQPGEAERHAIADYGFYLAGDKRLRPIWYEDLMAGRTVVVPECEVVAWGTHGLRGRTMAEAMRVQLQAMLGQPVAMRTFDVANDPAGRRAAYVFVAEGA